MIRIFAADTLDFSTNGLTVLDKCINPQIVEELNGDYSFSMQYPIEDKVKVNSIIPASPSTEVLDTLIVGTQGTANLPPKSNYIQKGNIIFANGQPFRIYHIERNMNYISINAKHIFYDLLDNFLEDVRPTNLTGIVALDWVLTHTQYAHPFTSSGDVGGSDTVYFVRKNPVAAIMGQEGLIETWGGELVRDKFSIGLWQARGNDNGVLIMGGKNIKGIKDILDDSDVITRLMPIGKDGLLLTEKYIDSPYINNYPHPKIDKVEFSDIQDEATLRTTAQKYMADNKIDIPLLNYSIDFIALERIEEYKNFTALKIVEDGDTVTARYKKLNIDIKAKVIKTTKKYIQSKDIWVNDKVELGNFKPNSAVTETKILRAFTPTGKIKASKLQGTIDAFKASLRAMADSAETQVEKAILFEDKQEGSATYGAMAIGTKGWEIADELVNGEWKWKTFGTGKGIIAGMVLGGAIEINLDEGYIKIYQGDGSYSLFDVDGPQRMVNGSSHPYHYLTYSGTNSVGNANNADQSYSINLPDEFKNKIFSIEFSIYRFNGAVIPSFMQGVNIYVDSIDYDNAIVYYHVSGRAWYLVSGIPKACEYFAYITYKATA